jgi:hypothetical protein
MSPNARKITGFLLLAFLAVPTGLCSLAVTPTAIGRFSAEDALARDINPWSRDIGTLALICASIGFTICGLSIWGAIRLARARAPDVPPSDPAP